MEAMIWIGLIILFVVVEIATVGPVSYTHLTLPTT